MSLSSFPEKNEDIAWKLWLKKCKMGLTLLHPSVISEERDLKLAHKFFAVGFSLGVKNERDLQNLKR